MATYDELVQQAQDALKAQTVGVNPLQPSYIGGSTPSPVVGGSLFQVQPTMAPTCPTGYTYNAITKLCEPDKVKAAAPTEVSTTTTNGSAGSDNYGNSVMDNATSGATSKPTDWAASVNWTDPASLLSYQDTLSKVGYGKMATTGAGLVGGAIAGPAGAVAGKAISSLPALESVAQQRAMITLSKAMGNTDIASTMQQNLDKYIEENNLGGLTGGKFFTGAQRLQEELDKYGYDSLEAAKKDGFKNILNNVPIYKDTLPKYDAVGAVKSGTFNSKDYVEAYTRPDQSKETTMGLAETAAQYERAAAGDKSAIGPDYDPYSDTSIWNKGGLISRRNKKC